MIKVRIDFIRLTEEDREAEFLGKEFEIDTSRYAPRWKLDHDELWMEVVDRLETEGVDVTEVEYSLI